MSGTASGGRKWLFISDIDDTLTGDDAALEELAKAIGRHRDRLWFAVNSSRPSGSVGETLREVFPQTLVPDAVVTAMGTEITLDGAGLLDWERRFEGWPHARIFGILQGLGHRPHDAVYQTPRKVSFAVPGADAQAEARAAFEDAGVEFQVTASGTDDFDVLPPGAGKGEATRFLAGKLGLSTENVVASGDSGNDVALLKTAEHRIVVGNARRELVDALSDVRFYHAEQAHAAGVLEGLLKFGVIPDDVD